MSDLLDRRPILIALAGPNGAGKSTFYRAHLQQLGLRFVNADLLARDLNLDAYKAADIASQIRQQLLAMKESFIFETVFSDPAGEKLALLREAESAGYTVVLLFIGVASAAVSDQRVAMRVSQGGHDVPLEKVEARFPRVLMNLKQALATLTNVRVYDNSDLREPYRLVLKQQAEEGRTINLPLPAWLKPLLS